MLMFRGVLRKEVYGFVCGIAWEVGVGLCFLRRKGDCGVVFVLGGVVFGYRWVVG